VVPSRPVPFLRLDDVSAVARHLARIPAANTLRWRRDHERPAPHWDLCGEGPAWSVRRTVVRGGPRTTAARPHPVRSPSCSEGRSGRTIKTAATSGDEPRRLSRRGRSLPHAGDGSHGRPLPSAAAYPPRCRPRDLDLAWRPQPPAHPSGVGTTGMSRTEPAGVVLGL